MAALQLQIAVCGGEVAREDVVVRGDRARVIVMKDIAEGPAVEEVVQPVEPSKVSKAKRD